MVRRRKAGAAQSSPLRERVYLALRRDLMSGALAPGDRMGEERLAEHYGVSRTPVREALARLLADGLVARTEAGLVPYRPHLDDLDGLYELRVTLETRGIARIIEDDSLVHDTDMLGAELEQWRRMRAEPPTPDSGFVAEDERFHVVLLAASGNAALAEALAAVNARIRPVRMFDHSPRDRLSAAIDQHITIAELVVDGRLEAAQRALIEHIDASRAVVIERAGAALSMAKMARAVRG